MKLTIATLLEKHLKDIDERIVAGRLASKTRRDYLMLPILFREAGVLWVAIKDLTPTRFAQVATELEKSGRSLRTQKNIITAIKAIFNWGGPNGMEFFDKVNFGPRLKTPSLRAIEAEQERNSPTRFIDRKTIFDAIAVANPGMRVAIMLGINCGFYPSDSIALHGDNLFLRHEPPYHNFRRVKTFQQRKAVLWPETVMAINDYYNEYRRPRVAGEDKLLLTRHGVPYSHSEGGSSLTRAFSRILDSLGKRITGVGLGSLRHTYATVVDSIPDQTMIDLTMGHTSKSIQKRMYRQLNLDEYKRLGVLAERVRGWLYSFDRSSYDSIPG